ncbi:MAG: 2-dehydro-3-deoxyphosphooctonate aldolase [Candidatus Methanoperedenaceae archaeon GB37]|nr:MAG: 2-dehydro-3-deoxyphosphooctonate aldolase [Candidatus Methanoperedenaceae archaeon GB37]
MSKIVKIGNVEIGGKSPLVLISGPCVIEGEEITYQTALFLKELTQRLNIPFIFKSSYDKANRSSKDSYRGPGLAEGLRILKSIKKALKIPVISDVHCVQEVEQAAQVLDIIQIPAFLCRQTDLIYAVADTGLPVNVKKGQFLAPWDVEYIIEKITSRGNENILVTERGSCFGYNNLVVDFRSLVIMRQFGYPVVFDATHSVQLPGGKGRTSGGQREFVPYLARAAVAIGIDALFMEVHKVPEEALCDGPNAWPLEKLEELLRIILNIEKVIRDV